MAFAAATALQGGCCSSTVKQGAAAGVQMLSGLSESICGDRQQLLGSKSRSMRNPGLQ